MRRVLRRPELRLLVAGGVLLGGLRVLLPPPTSPPTSSSVFASGAHGAASDEELLYRAGAASVAADDGVVRARLLKLAAYLDLGGTAEESPDELVEQARRLGLTQEDAVLRRYLVEAARLAVERATRADAPDDDAVRAYYEAHAERFTTPARIRASQVYLSRARRGAALDADAADLLATLRRHGVGPDAAAGLGDPFVRGPVLDGTEPVLARVAGRELASSLATLPAGSWQGPVASPYGLHLVWIEQRTPAAVAPLERVHGRIVHALLRERGEARAQERLGRLRRHDADVARGG